MEIVKIKALDSFSHGRLRMVLDEMANIRRDDAEDLEKAGLITIEGGADSDAVDDLVNGKMEPITQNKMDKAPSNKQQRRES